VPACELIAGRHPGEKRNGPEGRNRKLSMIEQLSEVEASLTIANGQWTQFEELPCFVNGVDEVRRLDDTHLHWVAQVGGSRHEWDADPRADADEWIA
jgi:uncharacterized membrane protein